jgi:hypothetical protein
MNSEEQQKYYVFIINLKDEIHVNESNIQRQLQDEMDKVASELVVPMVKINPSLLYKQISKANKFNNQSNLWKIVKQNKDSILYKSDEIDINNKKYNFKKREYSNFLTTKFTIADRNKKINLTFQFHDELYQELLIEAPQDHKYRFKILTEH